MDKEDFFKAVRAELQWLESGYSLTLQIEEDEHYPINPGDREAIVRVYLKWQNYDTPDTLWVKVSMDFPMRLITSLDNINEWAVPTQRYIWEYLFFEAKQAHQKQISDILDD